MIKILCFTAPWCSPCKIMKPVIKQIGDENQDKFEFTYVDIEEDPTIAQSYMVRGIPTYVVLKDDKEVGRTSGVQTKTSFLEKLNTYL